VSAPPADETPAAGPSGEAPGEAPQEVGVQHASALAALRIRLLVLKRRYGSPFEAVLLLVTCLMTSWVAGKAATKIDHQLLDAAISVACLVYLGFALSAAWHLLFRTKELVLLLTQGVSRAALVQLRLFELSLAMTLLLLPLLAAARGLHVIVVNTEASPALWCGALLLGPALAATGILGAWLLASFGPRARKVFAVAAVLGAVALAFFVPEGLRAALLGRGAPGPAFAALAQGELLALQVLLPTTLVLIAACGVLAQLAARGHGPRLDRASPRSGGRVRSEWLARPLRALLPQPLGALIARDLTLVLRGAAPRAWLILFGLPGVLALVPAFASDASLLPWQLRFAVFLLVGIMASASGFLFGVDLPLTRRECLIVERTQPLRGWQVLVARWLCAGTYALALGAGASACVTTLDKPELAAEALNVLLGAVPLALLVSHHAVAFGLRGEAEANPAEASGYPFTGGVVVLGFAFLIALHPALSLLYVFGWAGFTQRALVIWERSEVADQPKAAA
jgi:hypothetical protein